MKLLFFINSLHSGGMERRLTELLQNLRGNQEIDYQLVLMSSDIHYKEVLNLNIKIHFLIRKTNKDISIFQSFYRICKNYQPHIVHCWDSMTAMYCVPVCRLLNIKIINGMVTNSPQKRNILNKHYLRARLTFPFSDYIIGNSESGLNAYKAPTKKSRVIYNGFNFERLKNLIPERILFEQLGINKGPVVGMVATYSVKKDYPTYFKAAQLLLERRSDVTFLAVGSDTDSELCFENIDNRFLNNFRLLGNRNDVESIINIMDICVLATYTEGVSNSILEYMAQGKPVIATDGGGTREIMVDNITGFLIRKKNPQELAEKIEILLENDNLRRQMGQEGKKRIKEHFTIENMVNAFTDVYKVSVLD